MNKRIILFSVLVFSIFFVSSASATTDWLDKDAWSDRPSYAEDISIEYSPTDRIEKRETVKRCVDYDNDSIECNEYENVSKPTDSVFIFNFTSSNNEYLGDGDVRTNLVIGLNDLSLNTLMETTFLMSESEYIDWFNQNYYYEEGNITGADLDELQTDLKGMYADGSNTNIRASKVNSYSITSLQPFRAEADTTIVFRFNDFKTGSFKVSDLVNVEVTSSID